MPEALVRLYDLPACTAGDSALTAGRQVVHLPGAGARSPAHVELWHGDTRLGRCTLNARGPGTVGPARCEAAPELDWTLTRLALERLRWLGYAYGLVDVPDSAPVPPQAAAALWWLPDAEEPVPAAERDVPELEWGDFFIDLRRWTPPPPAPTLEAAGRTLQIRRPETSEHLLLTGWIRTTFGGGWASEVHRSFARDPVSSVIVVDADKELPAEDRLLGFISYDTARLGMLSSIALAPAARGLALTVAGTLIEQCLSEAHASGMPYAVLGGVSHRRQALRYLDSLWTIPGSCPGIFGKGVRN
ncbi:GNAT family N-acetyltransferase [Streptomyces sp. NPDC091377]|uniref:GNAT family N-acetyltransferase n=1 Tax=Streptomyces sp. NPDC091377 TaxID=3365995 RepID=UPI0037F74EB0